MLDMCNDNDVPLFTKKTFAVGQPPMTSRKPPTSRPPSMLAFTATMLAFHLISKAFRPEFETLAEPEQAPDRDSTMHGLLD